MRESFDVRKIVESLSTTQRAPGSIKYNNIRRTVYNNTDPVSIIAGQFSESSCRDDRNNSAVYLHGYGAQEISTGVGNFTVGIYI